MRAKTLLAQTAAILCLAMASGPATSQTAEPEPAAAEAPEEAMSAEDMRDFIAGNLFFLAYHELGHAIISEFDLPVIGREEDGVDRLATWMMTPGEITEETMPVFLINAVFGWMSVSVNESLDKIAWWGQHGTSEQRGYQVACLLYGDNPQVYKAVADGVDLPRDRRESCIKETAQNSKAWDRMLEPYIRAAGESEQLPPDYVGLDYSPSQKFDLERKFMMEIGVLEDLQRLVRAYKFAPGVTLRSMECGEANAFWNSNERSLTICYELVSQYVGIVQQSIAEDQDNPAAQ